MNIQFSRIMYSLTIFALLIAIGFSVPALVTNSIAKKQKVQICHIPPGNPENAHAISVSEKAVKAHLAHGDYIGSCGPEVCDTGTDAESGAPWVVCEANENDAWISHLENGGTYNAVSICQELGYDGVGEWGGTCGNVCGYCEGETSCESPGNKVFDSNGGTDPSNISNTVNWSCVNF